MIGIGITTKDRPDILANTLAYINRFMPSQFMAVVSDDSESEDNKKLNIEACGSMFDYIDNSSNRGIARNKNSCIRALSHCDYIFLFDDDCFPIKDGWAEYVINCHKESGVHHFNLLDRNLHQPVVEKAYDNFIIEEHRLVGGVFMFLTKEVVEKVGAFNKDYDVYGFEHASYTYRVFRSGLHNGLGINLTINNLQDYIFSLDYSSFAHNRNHKLFKDLSLNFNSNFASSMTQEAAQASIRNNQLIMAQDVNGPIYREL